MKAAEAHRAPVISLYEQSCHRDAAYFRCHCAIELEEGLGRSPPGQTTGNSSKIRRSIDPSLVTEVSCRGGRSDSCCAE